MKKCRKMISLIMLVVMLVSLLPSGAMAADVPAGGTDETVTVEGPQTGTDAEENEGITNEETNEPEEIPAGTSVSEDKEKDPAEDGTSETSKSEEPTDGNTENAGLGETSTEIAPEEEYPEGTTENAGMGETSTEIAAAVEPVDETVKNDAKAATSYEYEIKLGDSVSVKDLAVKAGLVTEEEAAEFAAGIAAVEFSNECVTVTHDSDWMLECVKVFQTPETLTITMADGTVHTVSVTCGTDVQVEFLDGDWAYISEFGLNTEDGIIDGTETWDDLDDGPSNKKVRTFDVVTYNMHYSTAMYENTGLQNVSEGYMCYKFVLPADKMQAEWDTGSMGWLGTEYKNAAELESYTAEGGAARANKSGGYYKYTDSEGNQVIEGKRYITPTEGINPYAFPGSGTLAASVQVLIPDYGFEIIPEFYLWLDHNTKDGDCAEHERDEVKSFIADPVRVVSELRLNALINAVVPQYSSYIGNYEFDNADSSEINYGEGTVYGATAIYGVTLQLYNKGIDKGLRGCALPTGDITIDVKLNASYKPDNGAAINLTEMGYKPLVYSYDTNDGSKDSRIPGRPVEPALADYALNCGPIDYVSRTPETPFTTLSGGTYRLWQGGNWAAAQNGATASFTNYEYTINPNWFPNSGNSDAHSNTYYDYTLGVRACDVGCFSALEMYVVYPTKFVNNEGETIDLVQDFGPGTIMYQTSDVKLMADSSAGPLEEAEDNSNQKKTDDDATAGSLYLSRPGSYSTIIRYNRDYTNGSYDTLGHYPGYIYTGQDSAGLGQELAISWTLNNSTNGQPSAMISAAQSLIKLDADALQLGEKTFHSKADDENVAVTFLYGAKPDGSNWTSDDEQNSAREADLVWYTSYQEIEEQGKKCVAILAEWRIQDSLTYYSNWEMRTAQQAFVRNDPELSEKVYPIIIVEDFWTRKDMADLGMDINDFPSRMDVQAGTAEMPELSSAPWVRDNITRTSPHEIASVYNKAVYENGAFIKDHNGQHHWGDSLYIVAYKASIKKILGQKNENGTDHQVFDLDNGQRVADYGLSVELKTDQPAAQLGTTTVTVTDVLPKGLSYIPESAYYGGTYEQTRLGMQGTVTGGISHEPDNIEPNEDGTTTLTWIIEDAQIGTTLPTIFYSCEIGHAGAPDDVQNNQSLTNTATVMSTEDTRKPEKANYKLDDASIRVSKLIATSVSKVADSKFVEATDDIGWTMYVGNNAINDIRNAVMLDTLPAFEDKAGTRIASDNKMKITEWTIDTTKASNVDTWIAFYTKDSKASQFISSDFTYDSAQGTLVGNPYSENYDESNTITWTPVEISVSGGSASIPGIYGIENITGVAVVGTLKGRETYQAHVKVKYSDPLEDGNRLVNTISRGDDTSKSTVYTAVRSLEGIVWKDYNMDGYRGHTGSDSEDVVSGVQVTLMKLKDGGDAEKPEDYEPYVIDLGDEGTKTAVVQTGSVMDLKTGTVKAYDLGGDEYDSGHYRFDGLPEGTFAVKFEEGNYMRFATSVATKVDAGDDRYDSDAKPTYTDEDALSSAFIAGISMPPLSKIANSRYVSRYHDLGVYQTGDLEVSKTVESDIAADKNTEFKFKVTLGNTGINGVFGEMEFEDGVAEFTLKDGETKKAVGLPVGVTYTVEEEANSLFTTTSENESGTIVYTTGKKAAKGNRESEKPPVMGDDDDPIVISVSFVNTRKTGELLVTKVVKSDASADWSKKFNFTVTLSDTTINGTYGDMTFANGVATFTLANGEEKSAKNLPIGITYTVTEDAAEGFMTGKVGDHDTIRSERSVAAFMNKRITGGFKVTKSVTSSTASDHQKEFTFHITLSDQKISGKYGDVTFTNGRAEFKLKDKETITVTGLPTGVTYEIQETRELGFVAPSIYINEVKTTEADITFSNVRQEGGLIVRKKVVSPSEGDKSKDYSFTVTASKQGEPEITGTYGEMTFTKGKAEFTLKDGETKLATGLPIGTEFTVSETGDLQYFESSGLAGGVIPNGQTIEAEWTNTRMLGDLEVKKTVVSPSENDKKVSFNFTVTLDDKTVSGTFGDMTFNNGVAKFSLKDGESKVATGLPQGVKYTVAEAESKGFTTTCTGATGTIEDKNTAEFTNTRKTGPLTISKTVVSPVPAERSQEFTFNITLSDTTVNGTFKAVLSSDGSESDVTFKDGKAAINVAGGTSKTIQGLPAGVDYKVEEAADNNFNITDKSGDEGKITTGGATAAFENTRKTGSLEVTKSVTSTTQSDKTKDFTFTVTLGNTTINGKFGDMVFENGVATFTLKDGGKASADGLPTGVSYKVEETAADNFVTTKTGDEGTISAQKATADFTNIKQEGGLVVSKKVVSDVTADKTKEFSFKVTLDDQTVNGTYGEMTFTDGVAEFTLKDGGTKRAEGLAKGIKYTVEETKADDFTTSAEGATGTIAKDETKSAVFTNTRKTGDLEISKTVVSPVPAEKTAEYTFNVTLTHGGQKLNGKYGEISFEDGKAVVKVKGGESVKISGIPVGTEYQVEEESDSYFAVDKTDDSGKITSGKTSKAAFTNTRKTGSLKVTKEVINKNSTNINQKFMFTVTLGDTSISGTFGDMKFENGVAIVSLKDGETATATGLPIDVKYTVGENAARGFTTEHSGEAGVINDNESTAAFKNTYLAKGDVSLEAKKALNGRPLEEGQFTFVLESEDGKVRQVKTSDAGGRVYFDKINYTQDDMVKEDGYLKETQIKYTVTEQVETEAPGYTYSKEQYTITVTLKDNGNGTITATSDKKPEDLVFTNTYKAEGEIVLKAMKKLLGERALEKDQFTFELKDANGKVLSTKTNKEDGSVEFDAIKYTQDDIYKVDANGVYSGANTKTHYYTISEVIPKGAEDKGDGTYFLNGYTYDGTEYKVAVELTDNGDKTITAEVVGTEEPGDGEDTAEESKYTFTNAYNAEGTLKLDAEKEFTNGTLKGGEFEFELVDKDGNVLQSKKNDAAGNVSFDLMTYKLADVANSPYTYNVREVIGDKVDVKYDKTVYTVTVSLEDNGDGTLKVTKEIDNGGKLRFVNEQLNIETSIVIGGVKELKGRKLEEGEFKFVLSDANGKKVSEARNDASGNFEFGTITYNRKDLGGEKKRVYTYGIAEVDGGQRDIDYDSRAYTVVVTVTDNGDGTITATADKARKEIKFVNSVRTDAKTGDEAPLGVLFGGLGVGAVGLALIFEERRRKNRQK